MEQNGSFSQVFTFRLQGVKLPQFDNCFVPGKNLSATVKPNNKDSFVLRITIKNITEAGGCELAKHAAIIFFNSLVSEFPEYILEAMAPQPGSTCFESTPNPSTPSVMAVTVSDTIRAQDSIELGPYDPNHIQLENIRRNFELGLTASQISTNAPLYAAREMFAVGMQSDNKLVRFLILYSAVTLAAFFNNSADGSQDAVDKLLLGINPLILYLPTGTTRSGKPKKETLYTKLRNDFVHAEKRGCAPDVARDAIEQHIAAFQRDVAKVLK